VLDIKLAALTCYEAESRIFPHSRSPEGLRILAQKRGIEAGLLAAEAFVITRSQW
jgi:N-acetylglucosamine malate deacetylase 1